MPKTWGGRTVKGSEGETKDRFATGTAAITALELSSVNPSPLRIRFDIDFAVSLSLFIFLFFFLFIFCVDMVFVPILTHFDNKNSQDIL